MNMSPTKTWILHPCLHIGPFQDICFGNVIGTFFLCLTLVSIYIDPWKSFMKFGIQKSHEMISYILVGMDLLNEWNM
jgi:hypothetical protein